MERLELLQDWVDGLAELRNGRESRLMRDDVD
jgi:hypothetical protein